MMQFKLIIQGRPSWKSVFLLKRKITVCFTDVFYQSPLFVVYGSFWKLLKARNGEKNVSKAEISKNLR